MWFVEERGQGRPLVLLHGIGMSHAAFRPVMETLARERRVLAFDVAGFGRSPRLPASIPPTTTNLVLALRDELTRAGITGPVDYVGNSMGGWMALEAARLGHARSVVAISPAGLWRTAPPAHVKPIFATMRRAARVAPRVFDAALRIGALRELFLAVPLSTGGRNIPAEDAIATTKAFVAATGFDDTLANATAFVGGRDIRVPVTVAFGTHDWLLTGGARLRDELPAHTRWLEPPGWGHMPMWKDPEGVARLVLEGTRGPDGT